jgi:hypothetical protein
LQEAFPDQTVLYSYPNEYTDEKKPLLRLAELPNARAA